MMLKSNQKKKKKKKKKGVHVMACDFVLLTSKP